MVTDSTRHIQRLIEHCQFYSIVCDKSKSAIGGHCVCMSCAVQGCPSITSSRVYYVGEQCQAVITSANYFAIANAVRKTFAYRPKGLMRRVYRNASIESFVEMPDERMSYKTYSNKKGEETSQMSLLYEVNVHPSKFLDHFSEQLGEYCKHIAKLRR